MSATSVEVPPISYAMAFSTPASASVTAAAMTPDAGPDITVFAASRATTGAGTVPPLPFMTRRSREKPRLERSRESRAM
jgi:hypothetical protein